MPTNVQPSRLIPVTDWERHHTWPPIGGLRHLINNETENGFSRCVRRIGRRVLIDEAEFFAWAESVNHPKKIQRRRARGLPPRGIVESVDAINAAAEIAGHE